jgi:hypothetical protein
MFAPRHEKHFDGYLMIHDDMLVSPDSLMKLDLNKIWIGDELKRHVRRVRVRDRVRDMVRG